MSSHSSDESSSEESTVEIKVLPPPVPPAPKKKSPTLKRRPDEADLPLQPPTKKVKKEKSAPSRTPSKHWCFTINNSAAPEEVFELIGGWPTTYVVYNHEVGENGTPHIQGYAEFSKPMRFSSLKSLPFGGMFTFSEAAKGRPVIIIK